MRIVIYNSSTISASEIVGGHFPRSRVQFCSIFSVSAEQYLVSGPAGSEANDLRSRPNSSTLDPSNDVRAQWLVGKMPNGRYFIQSVSSAQFIHGEVTREIYPSLDDGQDSPAMNEWLHWTLDPIDESQDKFAIRNFLSDMYLDGRAAGMDDVALTRRNPSRSEYLHWIVKPVESQAGGKMMKRSEQQHGEYPCVEEVVDHSSVPWADLRKDTKVHYKTLEYVMTQSLCESLVTQIKAHRYQFDAKMVEMLLTVRRFNNDFRAALSDAVHIHGHNGNTPCTTTFSGSVSASPPTRASWDINTDTDWQMI